MSFAPKARAWFDLLRIYNVPIPLCGMLAGAYAAVPENRWRLLAAPAAALLGAMVTQSFNDYEDRDTDAVNAPFRPLPSGKLEPKSVLLGGKLFALVGLIMSLLLEPWSGLIVVGTYLVTRLYPIAKRHTVLNHLLMPLALCMTPLYGSLVVHHKILPIAVYASVGIFLGDINMNVVGSFKDLWDDSAQERVLPVVVGARPAVVIAMVAGTLGILAQAAAVVVGVAKPAALVPLAIALLLLVVSRVRLFSKPNAHEGYRALQWGRLCETLSFPALVAGVLEPDHAIPIILSCLLLAEYTQTLIPEAILPPEDSLATDKPPTPVNSI